VLDKSELKIKATWERMRSTMTNEERTVIAI